MQASVWAVVAKYDREWKGRMGGVEIQMNDAPSKSVLVEVEAQLVRLLYSNAPTGVAVNVLIGMLLCWVLYTHVPSMRLGLWLVAIILVCTMRFYNFWRFRRASPTDQEIDSWRTRFTFGAMLSATVWGVTPWLFGPFGDIYPPMVLAFALGGLMAGAAAILGGVLRIYVAYTIVIMGPISVWFVIEPQRLEFRLGAMLLVAVVALVMNGVVYRRMLRESIELSNALSLAKEEAEDANRAKSQFLSRMSHELRTPLSAIMGFAQLVQDRHARGSQHWQYLDQIITASDHLLELIDDLLDLSRIETKTVELHLEAVNCTDLLRE